MLRTAEATTRAVDPLRRLHASRAALRLPDFTSGPTSFATLPVLALAERRKNVRKMISKPARAPSATMIQAMEPPLLMMLRKVLPALSSIAFWLDS